MKKKSGILVLCILALSALMLLPSCENKVDEVEVWTNQVIEIANKSDTMPPKESREYIITHLPKSPILIANPEFMEKAEPLLKEAMIASLRADFEQDIEKAQTPEDKTALENECNEIIADIKASHVFYVNPDNTVLLAILDVKQDSSGNWSIAVHN